MTKAGILGGGQLGRMLLQAAINYPVETFLMEKDTDSPAAHLCHHFTKGDITNYDDVYNFGKKVDVLTIEIERVNIEALEQLELEGVKVFPTPAALKIIINKITQKEFYKNIEVPTSPFVITHTKADLQNYLLFLPAVHKIAQGGYDGKGVQLIHTSADIEKGFDTASVLEKMVEIKKELSIIIAVSQSGETVIYEPVDMVVDQQLNLLSYQISPAVIPEKMMWKAEAIAIKVVKSLKSSGIFAVELLVANDDNIYVNETAPRVHNSGHHSIEACYSSQFDMLWRVMLAYPMGNTDHIMPSAIVNIIGEDGHDGPAEYEGLKDVLEMDNVFVHIYGKKHTKPGRKMGHITVMSEEPQELLHKANQIKQILKVITK
jgi:5-(carboxyamino)imidazole ribonucleotide synthase